MSLSHQTEKAKLDEERPRYTMAQAARYLHLSPTTLRSWVVGRPYQTSSGNRYFRPLISPPSSDDVRLSFPNLIEAHVLRSLRTRHEVPMSALRTALDYAENKFKIKRLLLRDDLRTAAGTVLIEQLGQLIDLGASGQIVLKELLTAHLKRIDRDVNGLPLRLFPVNTTRGVDGPRIVAVDPRIAFGRPIISGKGVRTLTIVERLDAGEDRKTVAADYQLEEHEIDEAILYERAA